MLKKICISILMLITLPAFSADFDPTKHNIEIICAYPPGGTSDKVARIINEIFIEHGWKSTVLNKPGADTVIAANYVASAEPDGYTLFMGGTGFLDANVAFKDKAPGIKYTGSNFIPIIPLGVSATVLAVPASSPINSYADLKAYVKKNPKKFNVGYWNRYTANVFKLWAKLEKLPEPTIINYKGSAPQMTDLMGGQLDFGFDSYAAIKGPWEAGKIKIIATLTKEGEVLVHQASPKANIVNLSKAHPELDLNIWYGLYAPAGTDRVIVAEINALINHELKNPQYATSFTKSEITKVGGTPDQLVAVQTKSLNILTNVSKNIE